MDKSFDESKMFEQAISRATKPDESRKKSLYFLLMAIGRQRAATDPSLRAKYRHALNSLQIDRSEDYWKIDLEVDGNVISREIKRNAFKFYSTGLDQLEDHIVRQNTTAAHAFWKSIESDLMNISVKKSRENSRTSNVKFLFNNTQPTNIFTFVIIFLVLAPYLPKSITFLTLLLFPTLILIRGNSHKVTFALILLLVILATALDVATFQNNSSNPLSLHLLLFLTAWHEFRRVRLQHRFRSFELIANFIVLLILLIISLSTVSYPFSYSLLVSLIFFSELMRKVRKFAIENTSLVIVSVIFEISICLSMCIHLFNLSSLIKDSSNLELIVLSLIYLIWFVYFNLSERYTVSIRFFFPTVIVSATHIQGLRLIDSIAALTVILMISINSILLRSEKIL